MRDTDNRRHVMFAVRFERNIAQDDQFVIAFDFLEGALQELDRILGIPPEPVFVSKDDALWRIAQAFAFGIVARPAKECIDGLFGLFSAGPGR